MLPVRPMIELVIAPVSAESTELVTLEPLFETIEFVTLVELFESTELEDCEDTTF